MSKLNLSLFLAVILGGLRANAQSIAPPAQMKLLAKSYGDSIVLRWAPANAEVWRYAAHFGYILERMTLDDATNKVVEDFTPLSKQPVRPWVEAVWRQRVSAKDTLLVIAAECLLGKSKITPSVSGGDFVKNLALKDKEEQNRFSFALFAADLSATTADALGLRWVDKKVDKTKKYIYRLRLPDSLKNIRHDTALFVLATKHITLLGAPTQPQRVLADSAVVLQWLKGSATAYDIERSEDKGNTWQRLNKQPYTMAYDEKKPKIALSFTDRTGDNYVKRLYRLRAYTPFGEITPPSEAIEAGGVDLTPSGIPTITKIENKKGNEVHLTWQLEKPAPDFKGFLLMRATDIAGPYEEITSLLPPNTTSWVDKTADEFVPNFYKLLSVDANENLGPSLPAYVVMKNNAPPSVPTGLSGTIDTNGVVLLRWKVGNERDLLGYQVWFANQSDHTFHAVSNVLQDSVFTDTLNLSTLTEDIFYKIQAVDLSYATSPFSAVLKLKKPDRVPPVVPVFTDYAVTDSTITVNWAKSNSIDVTKTLLFRKEDNGAPVLLKELRYNDSSYVDKKVKKDKLFEYTLVAVDDSGMKSKTSFPLSLRPYDAGKREGVKNLTVAATPNEQDGSVNLSWQFTPSKDVQFVIFRRVGNGDMSKYASISGEQLSFKDNRITKGETYKYSVMVIYRGGGSSALSKEVVVK
jgi:fibronectin type 3 domain-containing protein